MEEFKADTIMFSIYSVIRSTDCYVTVDIDVDNTDCFVQAAALSHKLDGPPSIKRKSQVLLCS